MWVVVTAKGEVQEQGYESPEMATGRIKHLAELDGVLAFKYPVRVNSVPAPVPFEYPPSMVRTVGAGQELHAYGQSAKFSLGGQVAASWLAWRQQQAALGNLDEAGQEMPGELAGLFESREGQLELFPRELP